MSLAMEIENRAIEGVLFYDMIEALKVLHCEEFLI